MDKPIIRWDVAILNELTHELVQIRKRLLQAEQDARQVLRRVHPTQRKSARNLVHYLALRRIDLRPLQPRLSALGLSSLSHSEGHVMDNLDAVLRIVHSLVRQSWPHTWGHGPVSFEEGRALLKGRTLELLGPKASGRWVRIMATMPGEAAQNPELVRLLLEAGMNCMRINCAHDNPPVWRRMVRHLRVARQQTGLPCKVAFDLGGPKLRTGPLAIGPQVLKWRPKRNAFGKLIAPARIWLTPAGRVEAPPAAADAILPVPRAWLKRLRAGNVIGFEDARGASRKMKVAALHGNSRWAECGQTAYAQTGMELLVERPGKSQRSAGRNRARVGVLPGREEPILLHLGDTLMVTRKLEPGRGALLDKEGNVKCPARICCTAPEIFKDVKPGERVWLDDGKIGAVIKSVSRDCLELRITHARAKGEKLRADKGINFPDSVLRLPSLAPQDFSNLPLIVRHADLIGYSFVQRARDIKKLGRELRRLRGSRLGIILKIETRTAFEHLPELLLAAMRCPRIGVMIARGDLAVECGYERLAEIQEEILWLCEAAHVPVIWATQVLEELARSGSPTRAEVTDAAMAARAECVMLNKGPEMVAAVRALDNILRRMQAHQNKKQSMLRSLRIARDFRPVRTQVRRAVPGAPLSHG